MTLRYVCVLTLAGLSILACSSDSDSDSDSASDPESASATENQQATPSLAFAGCERGMLEADFLAPPLAGPALRDGALPPGEYLVSSTYLQLDPAAGPQQLFNDLIIPVATDLQTRPGLLALSLGQSKGCGVARTLAVWQDEMAMLNFVASPAHTAAMSRVTDISRGGSTVTHWLGDEASVNWPSAARYIGEDDGPQY
jgi:hypothetical protein